MKNRYTRPEHCPRHTLFCSIDRFRRAAILLAVVSFLASSVQTSTAQDAGAGDATLKVAVASSEAPVAVSFIHVDTTGVAATAFANRIRLALAELDGVTATPGADLVLWLRTIEFPIEGNTAIGYSIVVDYNGHHITDNLGITTPDETRAATRSIVRMVAELAGEVRESGKLATR